MNINWEKCSGLVPAIIQDVKDNHVLMLGYMNAESLRLTQETRKIHFYSRSRKSLWKKGETSGNELSLVEILPDCDQDCLLVRVESKGPTCHRETRTCFENEGTTGSPQNGSKSAFDLFFLSELDQIISKRIDSSSRNSYVARLFQSGLDRITQKVGEEAIETVIASKNLSIEELEEEAADLVFHLMVLLRYKNSSLSKVSLKLEKRHAERTPAKGA